MDKEIIFMVDEEPDGGFIAKALGRPIFTQADSLDQLRNNVKEAVTCHFDDGDLPAIICLRFVKEEVIPV